MSICNSLSGSNFDKDNFNVIIYFYTYEWAIFKMFNILKNNIFEKKNFPNKPKYFFQ